MSTMSTSPNVAGQQNVNTESTLVNFDVDTGETNQSQVMSTDVNKDLRLDNLARDVGLWVETTHGYFTNADVDRQFMLTGRRQKQNRWTILGRLVNAGFLEKHTRIEGTYRRVIKEVDKINWREADTGNFLDLKFPFKLEELVKLYPKNIAVIAGEPNAGKTCFCLSFIHKNMQRYPVDYYSSEMGAEEMRDRLGAYPISLDDWHFEAVERTKNFADIIHPGHISVIDYLEMLDNFYMVGQEIFDIWNKLKTGMALIAIQKKRGAILGRGGEFGSEKPRLYLSMGSGEMHIVKAKKWANATTNPNGMKFTFKIHNGWQFEEINRT